MAELKTHALVFAALGDETRLAVLAKLSLSEPQSIARLTAGTKRSRQALTKHLRVLESAGLIRGVRAGRETLFEFRREPMENAQKYLGEVARQWDNALERLRSFVED
jgi:DNA-binding transcriptional ArsR family regulator